MTVDFLLRYSTTFGQHLSLHLLIKLAGERVEERWVDMEYVNENYWSTRVELDEEQTVSLTYKYAFFDKDGSKKEEGGYRKPLDFYEFREDLLLQDSWNDESFYENAFLTAPFTNVFFKRDGKKKKNKGIHSHVFRVQAPLLMPNESLILGGNCDALGNWETGEAVEMNFEEGWWVARIDLSGTHLPVVYKYGVRAKRPDVFLRWEEGDNRIVFASSHRGQVIAHDGFVRAPNTWWKGAGLAIPVFSLRSEESFGVGEFTDLKLLVDWSRKVGLKLIQLLPVNDTSATHTWKDSYPYAAISAFALHPLYINLESVAGKNSIVKSIQRKKKQLNAFREVDYEQVMQYKLGILKELYEQNDMKFLREKEYQRFYGENRSWLVPYAAFCYLRDRFGTSDFSQWKQLSVYDADEVARMSSSRSKCYRSIHFHYFVQYHLHLQLSEATAYAHKRGIVVKGDIPIGIYRYGADAWTAPELYNMDEQAGAPPDDFAVKGQNWGFPTYNWKRMAEDDFEWWRQRFRQMSNYFDAFRIDHILGFFRIWSIPLSFIEGIGGRFRPAIPVTESEFGQRGIWFNRERLCHPFITDDILSKFFGAASSEIKSIFLQSQNGSFVFKSEYDSQRKVRTYMDEHPEHKEWEGGLFELLSNFILIADEQEGSYHFRIAMDGTTSFGALDEETKRKLKDLYIDYYYRRQDQFWKKEAMQKLPALKQATGMLICGEDLGMVPHSVPEVMKELGILSLEIQRMPKDPTTEFFHPATAPYLSVVTPSSHDMSTVRGWWEEDRSRTQRFFNTILSESGTAPYFCEPWVNRAIILQHLYSPAMWSIFQLQDLLGMDEQLRRENPHEERINEPSNPSHYWNYRMHISLEELLEQDSFNIEITDYLHNSGRAPK